MGIFDVIGPVMVGPSSSHTAGAVRIGRFAMRLLGEVPSRAVIRLHGSFAATGQGHGTHLALVAGLLGLLPSDERIPKALELASEQGMSICFEEKDLGEVHANSVALRLESAGRTLDLAASSIGGGQIRIWELDGFSTELEGLYPTLLFVYPDQPGAVAEVSRILAEAGRNIAAIKAHRQRRGGLALMEVQLDDAPSQGVMTQLAALPRFQKIRFVPSLEEA